MAETLKLDLVTPTGEAISEDFEMIGAAGVEGEFGVLPGHAPFLTLLKPGVVKAEKEGRTEVFAVRSGVAEVEPDKVVIMTQEAAAAGDIDLEEAERELKKAEAELRGCAEPVDSVEFKALEERAAWHEARRSAASHAEK